MAVSEKNLAESQVVSVFPWRNNNHVELYINGESFFPEMLEVIAKAKHYILLEMYLVESGIVTERFIHAFVAAANRGVKVYLLLDGFGSGGLNTADQENLQHENITLKFYNPLKYGKLRRNLFRDHRKILVVDQHCAFVGGVGLSDDFISTEQDIGWRETVIKISGECVCDWISVFSKTWHRYSKLPLPGCEETQAVEKTVPCRVSCSLRTRQSGIKRSLIKRIRSAERTICISTAYFVPSLKLRRALVRAAKRGVDVRLLLPGEKSDHPAVRHVGRRFYYRLLRAGIKIYEYQPRFLHQKVLLCDSWVSIGSSNIDRWNFRWNLEANQEVEAQVFTNKVMKMLEEDFANSQLIELSSWLKRPWYYRVLEWFWGKVDQVVDKILR